MATIGLESYERAFSNDDTVAQTVRATKPELDQLEHTYRQTHYNRLSREEQASVDSSHIHLDLVDYLRRINAYAESIAHGIIAQIYWVC